MESRGDTVHMPEFGKGPSAESYFLIKMSPFTV